MALRGFIQRRCMSDWQRSAFNWAGFRKYGLWRDDLIIHDDDVTEALRRLPGDVVDARNFRIMRAQHLSCCKEILPRSKWTKFEEDILYLTPTLEQVIKEREERQAWNKQH